MFINEQGISEEQQKHRGTQSRGIFVTRIVLDAGIDAVQKPAKVDGLEILAYISASIYWLLAKEMFFFFVADLHSFYEAICLAAMEIACPCRTQAECHTSADILDTF